jgi:myo-inositol-1-phosphate synthase
MRDKRIQAVPAQGRLGVAIVGAGALSTTLIAGVLAVRRGLAKPIGARTQLGLVPGPEGSPGDVPIGEAVPLVPLSHLAFGLWDILPDSAYASAVKARVLERDLLEALRADLESIRPWRGIFDPRFVRRLRRFTRARARDTRRAWRRSSAICVRSARPGNSTGWCW